MTVISFPALAFLMTVIPSPALALRGLKAFCYLAPTIQNDIHLYRPHTSVKLHSTSTQISDYNYANCKLFFMKKKLILKNKTSRKLTLCLNFIHVVNSCYIFYPMNRCILVFL